MTPKDKYGQCTVDGCRRMINELYGLDASLTVWIPATFLVLGLEALDDTFTNSCPQHTEQ